VTGGSPHIDLAACCLAGRYLGMAERWLNITPGGRQWPNWPVLKAGIDSEVAVQAIDIWPAEDEPMSILPESPKIVFHSLVANN